jgi:hypothetical protein
MLRIFQFDFGAGGEATGFWKFPWFPLDLIRQCQLYLDLFEKSSHVYGHQIKKRMFQTIGFRLNMSLKHLWPEMSEAETTHLFGE